MTITKQALWERLDSFDFPLSNGRSLQKAVQVAYAQPADRARILVQEYSRFMYLVAASNRVLAPSHSVDMVWHLHLEDSKAYAGDFTKLVMTREIRHHTGRPAPAKDPAYLLTLQRYREEFDKPPYAKVWPDPTKPSPFAGAHWPLGCFAVMALGLLSPWKGLIVLGGLLGALWLLYHWATAPWTLRKSADSGGCGGSFGSGREDASHGGDGDSGGGGDGGGGCGGD